MQEWKREREARPGAGPGAVVFCSATAIPCVAGPADGGQICARTLRRLRETGCLILQVVLFLLTMLSIARVPRDQLELSVFSDFKCSVWGC